MGDDPIELDQISANVLLEDRPSYPVGAEPFEAVLETLLLPLGHALIERPPMRGNRVAVITMGGSWGVVLSDFLEEAGL